MKTEHVFFLPITPLATQRSRCACRGRYPTVYTEGKYKEWKAEAVEALKSIASVEDFRAVAGRPVLIRTEVVVTRPETTKLHAPRGDIDNYEKGLWDAITQSKGWWTDDKQIVENQTSKRWADEGEPEGYYISITFLGDAPFSQ